MDFGEGTVDLPIAGKVKKRYVMIPAGIALAYVAYQWYRSSQSASSGDAGTATDGMYTTPDQSEYGMSTSGGDYTVTGNTGSTTTDATNGLSTNDQWANLAVQKLTDQGYDGMTVTAALGDFLARRSLTPQEATIARAAVAVAGQPPVGGPFPVNEAASTGNTTLAAPTGLHVVTSTSDSVTLAWNPVAGAGYYRVYRSGASTNVGATDAGNHQITVTGLAPNTSYSFRVSADTTTGKPGPQSAAVTGKTKAVTLKVPTGLKASAITRTSFRVTCSKVSGATYYRWYINGDASGASDQPYRDFTGLKPNTTYHVSVAADTTNQTPSKPSTAIAVKTKK